MADLKDISVDSLEAVAEERPNVPQLLDTTVDTSMTSQPCIDHSFGPALTGTPDTNSPAFVAFPAKSGLVDSDAMKELTLEGEEDKLTFEQQQPHEEEDSHEDGEKKPLDDLSQELKDQSPPSDQHHNLQQQQQQQQQDDNCPDLATSTAEEVISDDNNGQNYNNNNNNITSKLEAHHSFETAFGNSILPDCDKSQEMEFTKNYSDDLLMGQSDGGGAVNQGELGSGGPDLADFELPPYSGSSSGSEPRHHSPAKRKSSASSTAAQATSSSSQHQAVLGSVAPPNLSAVKELLMASYSKISHIFHWKRPIETGVYFAMGVTLITALTFFSIISVVAYTALGIISASGLIRLYKTFMKALGRPTETPFDHVWEKVLGLNVAMSPQKVHELVDNSLGNFNASLVYFKQVLLIEDKLATLKFALFLYLLTHIGAWFNGMTLITVGYLALFSIPPFYEKNKAKIDQYVDVATGQVTSAMSAVSNKVSSIAFGSASSSSSATKKHN